VELTGRFPDQDRVATWRSDDGGAVANEEPGRALLWPAVLVGVGVAGSLDEIVLHQLLRWHHSYDRASQAAGLIADGIFHLGSTAALVIGLVLLVQRWPTGPGPLRQAAAGILLGAGGFNLYDGTVQHKLLDLHQVRAGARPTTFLTTWCSSAWPPRCCWPGCSWSGRPVRREARQVRTVRCGEPGDRHGQEARWCGGRVTGASSKTARR
jgi:uncharacterized membrane protein